MKPMLLALAVAAGRASAGAAGGGGTAPAAAAPAGEASAAAAKVAVAPVLIEYVNALKSEAEASHKRAHVVDQWCSESSAQKAGFVAALQRQLDEVQTAGKELALQERRLESEARIANATCAEKERQLRDAEASSKYAVEEFQGEQQRVERTMGDTERALKLVEQERARIQDDGDVQATPDDEPAADDKAPKAEKMLLALRELKGRLAQETRDGEAEKTAMLRKVTNFSEHLNSALMQAQSQVAAIRVEAAQRRREASRLRGREASLAALLGAARASAAAGQALCRIDGKHRGEVPHLVHKESVAVAALLDTGSASASASRSAILSARVAATAVTAFLQVTSSSGSSASRLESTSGASLRATQKALEDLRGLARRFPEEAELYTAGLQSVLGSATVLPVAQVVVKASGSRTASDEDAPYDPLNSVRKFVDEEGGVSKSEAAVPEAPSAAAMDKVRGLYGRLLTSLSAKEAQLTTQEEKCATLLLDAAADRSALERAAARLSANLRLAETTMAEYKQASEQNAKQRSPIAESSEKLGAVSKQVEAHLAHVADRLNSYAQRLITLESSADIVSSADDAYFQRVKNLIQRVEEHKVLVQRHSHEFQAQSLAAGAADAALLKALDEDLKYGARQMAQLKAQSAILAARAEGTASDGGLAAEFDTMVHGLCSEEHMAKLRSKIPEVQQQERFLNQAFSSAPPAH